MGQLSVVSVHGILTRLFTDEESTVMKKWAVTALGLAMGITAGVAQAEVGKPMNEAVNEAVKGAVKALWQDQHKAFDAHNVDGVLTTYADSDDIMLMGTGPGEHWVGKDEVKDAYTHFMEQFDAHTMEVQCGEGAGSSQGDVVWLTGVCNFSDKKADQARQYVINLSAVLVKQGDAWRFHTMHFSHLTGGGAAEQQSTPE